MEALHYLTHDEAGNVTGVGLTPDGSVPPSGAVVCTQEQAKAWQGSTIRQGAIVPPPAEMTKSLALFAEVLNTLNAGLTIKSAGTPSFNGTYPVSQSVIAELGTVAQYIQANGVFPGGAGMLPWDDVNGVPHIIPTLEMFTAVNNAIHNYWVGVKLYRAQVSGVPLPPTTVTIE